MHIPIHSVCYFIWHLQFGAVDECTGMSMNTWRWRDNNQFQRKIL